MCYELLKTNHCEVSFLDGIVRHLYLVAEFGSILVPVEPKGPYTFEIMEPKAQNPKLISICFQKPYFEYQGAVISMTPYSMSLMKDMMDRRNADIERIMASKKCEVFFMALEENNTVLTLGSMPSKMVARGIMSLMDNDPNFGAAMKEELMKQAMGQLDNLMMNILPVDHSKEH
jgi:hypothetical protein